jgi:hypothetical protein
MMNAYTDEYYEYTPRRMGKGERLSRAREIEKIECKIDELKREIQNLKEKSQIPKEPENGLVYFQVRYLGGVGKLYTFMAVRGLSGKWSSTGSRGQFNAPSWVEFVKLVRNRCVESTFSEVAVGEELR